MATRQRRTVCRAIGIWQILLLISLTVNSSDLIGNETSPKALQGPSRVARDFGIPQVGVINTQIGQSWIDNEVTPSAAATDGEFCRRLFLDLIGRIPSTTELESYLADRRPGKQRRLVERLLYDDAYRVEYTRHWSTVWNNTLIGRSGGDERNSPIDRDGMLKYLRDSFAHNKPYNTLVKELVSATGTNKPGTDSFNGAVNFLAGKLEEGAAQATAQTSKIFLGLQVQCTQCHNHPFNEWKQQQYWQMNAFFRQTRTLRRYEAGTRDVRFVELTDEDFAGEDRPIEPDIARVYYELRNGRLEAALPTFVDGTSIDPSGYLEDVNRREQLSQLILRSDYMPRIMVNRTWAQFLGYGFTKPVDDMGPHNPAVNPELLNYLADEFSKNSYDIKQLMTWIVLSQPYGLSSKTTKNNREDDPQLGNPPQFSHFYVRQMTAEQLYESLLLASGAAEAQGSYQKQQKAKDDWLRQFTIAFGTDEGDETTTFDGTITQTLMMFNGDLIKQATKAEKGSFLHDVVTDSRSRYTNQIQQLFLAALSRRANKTESRMAQQLLAAYPGDGNAALKDLWWALLNSNEFILNH
ncbi:MAG: DUF1549 domain-containing protein [Pirellulaceae bacterium]|nr:DUF1549 domain-containing protein [Pirellulaceae bacterium]